MAAQPAEEMQFDQVRAKFVLGGKSRERLIERQQLILFIAVKCRCRQFIRQLHLLTRAAMAQGAFSASIVDEYPPHRFSRRMKEMRAVGEFQFRISYQANVGVMYQRGRRNR